MVFVQIWGRIYVHFFAMLSLTQAVTNNFQLVQVSEQQLEVRD